MNKSTFVKELKVLINRHSMENMSNTPDYILVEYLMGCLDAFANTVNTRDRWHRHKIIDFTTRYKRGYEDEDD